MRLFTTTLALLLVRFVSSQADFPFAVEGAVWDIEYSEGGPDPFLTNYTERYFVQGDTVINSQEYKKVYYQTGYSYYGSFSNPTSTNVSLPEYFCGLRRDHNGNEIMYRKGYDDDEAEEVILYNFTLDLNDTILLRYGSFQDYPYVIKAIDSILVDGTYRRRFNHFSNEDSWIEGIGSIYGPFFPFFFRGLSESRSLMCYKENEHVIYSDQYLFSQGLDTVNGCNLFSPIIQTVGNQKLSDDILISINQSSIKIKSRENYNGIRIINILGQIAYESETDNRKEITIDMNGLDKGIYIIQLSDRSNEMYSEKIMVR